MLRRPNLRASDAEQDVKDEKRKRVEEVALFRYGLIAELAQLEPGTKGLYRLIEEKAAKDYAIPGSARTRVAEETLRDWLKAYRKGGLDRKSVV